MGLRLSRKYESEEDNKMANLEGMNIKFTVVKNEDLDICLNGEEKDTFCKLVETIETKRRILGKKNNTYLVINTDEHYADEVIEILKSNGHWG